MTDRAQEMAEKIAEDLAAHPSHFDDEAAWLRSDVARAIITTALQSLMDEHKTEVARLTAPDKKWKRRGDTIRALAEAERRGAEEGTRPTLNDRQIASMRIGEQALEDLPFRDRDDLIAKGLAIRAWPKVTEVDWKTWLTPAGAKLRLELFDPYSGIRTLPAATGEKE